MREKCGIISISVSDQRPTCSVYSGPGNGIDVWIFNTEINIGRHALQSMDTLTAVRPTASKPVKVTLKLGKTPGPRFNIKMTSYQYRKSHCGDKTILRPSYLHNGISYTGKTTSLNWTRAVSIRKTVLPGMAIPMLKIRRPNGRLIFNMEIAIRR